MKTKFLKFIAVITLALSMGACVQKAENESRKPIIIAYVGGYNGLVETEKLSPEKITHINYAFVNVENGKAVLTNLATDSINFRKLNLLKEKNPELKILISLGGWVWSRNFSDAVLTPEAREIFAQSAVDIMTNYKLDGIDIDWEYPALPGDEGHIYRPEDTKNYTLMFAVIREKLDALSKTTKQHYLLTTAVGGSQNFVDNTEMAEVQKYLDYVNLMTYDYQYDSLTIHHTNLYKPTEYSRNSSADMAVKAYLKAGVPAEKLVMGIAFYGRSFQLKGEHKNGLGDQVEKQSFGKGFSFIKDSLENQNGYTKLWDNEAKAPYLYNNEKGIFFTYDDEQSVQEKCKYTLENNMAGVMFWEYSSDPKEYLLDAINQTFK